MFFFTYDHYTDRKSTVCRCCKTYFLILLTSAVKLHFLYVTYWLDGVLNKNFTLNCYLMQNVGSYIITLLLYKLNEDGF